MLSTRNMQIKSHEQMMDEAVRQIPLYTKEWTNFNVSDPGITVLENLSSLNLLQAADIEKISPQIRERLLGLTGMVRRPGGIARVLLESSGMDRPFQLMANERFMLDTTSFETQHAVTVGGCRLKGIYAQHGGKVIDVTYLADREVPLSCNIFGKAPAEGDCIYLVSDSLPEAGEEAIFYIRVDDEHGRNPSDDGQKTDRMFASMKWECFTEDGYRELDFRDTTGCFIRSGELHLRMPQEKAAVNNELAVTGFVIRGTLLQQEYDIVPKLRAIRGFLFEVWQKDTQSVCYTYNKPVKLDASGDILDEGYISIFCREDRTGSYYRYSEYPGDGSQGRYFTRTKDNNGHYVFDFDKKQFGNAPAYTKNAVKLVAYNEYSMRHYRLGRVEGYDEQTIALPFKNIVPDTFSLMAERADNNNENIYDFVKPGRNEEGSLYFTIDENEGMITILDAGNFIGAELFLCAVAVTKGPNGNVRENNTFHAARLPKDWRFTNPAPGTGGAFRESLASLRKRFIMDVDRPATAVTAADYEELVRSTPDLCIDRIHAWTDTESHVVYVAVRPASEERFADIPKLYMDAIRKKLEKHRLVNTTVRVTDPVYAAINVIGTVCVRDYVTDEDRSIIEVVIRDYLDFDRSGRNFGEVLRFEELFNRIEALEIVDYVEKLELIPQNPEQAVKTGMDVRPEAGSLTYTGEISLDIIHAL